MKINRHGKAKILTPEELQLIFNHGLTNIRDKTLFAVCLFTACRIREAVTLITADIYSPTGEPRPEIIIRKGHSKGRLATRSIPTIEDLRTRLVHYYPHAGEIYLFPGRHQGRYGGGHLHWDSASRILREALARVGITGAATHSFRRTALTQISNNGIPLRVIQEVSGHRNLNQLQKYLEVTPAQVRGAVASLSLIAPTDEMSCYGCITTPTTEQLIKSLDEQ